MSSGWRPGDVGGRPVVDGRTDTDGHSQPGAGAGGVSPVGAGAEEARSDLTRRPQRLHARSRARRFDTGYSGSVDGTG